MKSSDWISVKDRLPYVGECVLIALEMKYNHEPQMETAIDFGWLNEDGDFDMSSDWYEGQEHFKITHWQPIVLPKDK